MFLRGGAWVTLSFLYACTNVGSKETARTECWVYMQVTMEWAEWEKVTGINPIVLRLGSIPEDLDFSR